MYTSSFLGRSPSRFPNLLQPLRASGGFTTRFSSQNLTNASLSSVLLSLPISWVSDRPVTTTFSLRLAVSCSTRPVYINLHGACLCSQNSLGSIRYVVLTGEWGQHYWTPFDGCFLLTVFIIAVVCLKHFSSSYSQEIDVRISANSSAVLLSADCNPA